MLFKIDFSKELIGWVKDESYALLDVNLFPRPFVAMPTPVNTVCEYHYRVAPDHLAFPAFENNNRQSREGSFGLSLGQLCSVS